MATWVNPSSRVSPSRAFWQLGGSTGTLGQPQEPALIEFSPIWLCTNRFICGGPFWKWDLFACLFEMISSVFTGVWNHPWFINEPIKAAGLPCSGNWTDASEHSGTSTMTPNFNTHGVRCKTHCVLISCHLLTALPLWVCIKTQSFQSEETAVSSQATD